MKRGSILQKRIGDFLIWIQQLVSWRSPLPPIMAGIALSIVAISAVSLPIHPTLSDQTKSPLFSPEEILALVAHDMRSSDAAANVVEHGSAQFIDGTWYVKVGGASFHFSQRQRVVVAENDEAMQLEFRGAH